MQESRRHFRTVMQCPVTFATPDGQAHEGLSRDLSYGGVAVHTDTPAPFGARVVVFLHVGGLEGNHPINGIVRWTKDGLMGVQFGLMGAHDTYALSEILAGRVHSDR